MYLPYLVLTAPPGIGVDREKCRRNRGTVSQILVETVSVIKRLYPQLNYIK